MAQKMVLLGDEAIAQGGIDAGMSGIYAYPGTPSTEITEYVERSKEAKELGIKANWGANEKTALEGAIGMSYAGKRAMACMKHVGLNVAADAFMNAAITGVNGGLVVVAADDPSMHSSQNEQDSRFYGKFAMIPILEPNDQQESYDMVHYAFELSEKFKVPVLVRITTRLAHSRAGVNRLAQNKGQNGLGLPGNLMQYVLLPSNARKQYKTLLNNYPKLVEESETSPYNTYIDADDKSKGIIASGIAYNYLMENFPDRKVSHPVLKVGQYPMPRNLIKKICKECDEVIVIEEGYPFIEEMLRGYLDEGNVIWGRINGTFPRDGELNPNIVAAGLGLEKTIGEDTPEFVVGRPPSLCVGCSHIDSFNALNEAMEEFAKGRTFSDIGCYTLGALPPFNSINSCVDMGASITMAKGAADAGLVPSIAVIGDSTFTHSGMTGLLDAVVDNSPITVFILDNSTTGMTGGQPSHALGRLVDICKGIGVAEEHIRVLKPLKKYHEENVKVMKEEIAYQGVSVVIPQRECIQTLNRRMREKAKAKKASMAK